MAAAAVSDGGKCNANAGLARPCGSVLGSGMCVRAAPISSSGTRPRKHTSLRACDATTNRLVGAQGSCRICGQFGDLTFEHIPPKAAFNKDRVRSISLTEWVAREDLDYTGGRIQQRGMGAEVLCGRCNSFLGREYVIEYREWARWGLGVLSIAPSTPMPHRAHSRMPGRSRRRSPGDDRFDS